MRHEDKELLKLNRALSEADRQTLLRFARFLAAENPPPAPPADPVDIPRPAQESVIVAMKRLRATYPMLDATRFLDQASQLASQHFIHGKGAVEVIDQLEALFRERYEASRREAEPGNAATP